MTALISRSWVSLYSTFGAAGGGGAVAGPGGVGGCWQLVSSANATLIKTSLNITDNLAERPIRQQIDAESGDEFKRDFLRRLLRRR
jgi:hypothetical protein